VDTYSEEQKDQKPDGLDRMLTSPEPFNKDVVYPSSFAVHADRNAVGLQDTGELLTGNYWHHKMPRNPHEYGLWRVIQRGLNSEVPKRITTSKLWNLIGYHREQVREAKLPNGHHQ
jgi:hypothetical protein